MFNCFSLMLSDVIPYPEGLTLIYIPLEKNISWEFVMPVLCFILRHI